MECLKAGRDMKKLLEKVAQFGFVPLFYEDPLVKIGIENNVLGVVRSAPKSVIVGLPEKFLDENDYGVIASSQSMRLTIARALCISKNRE